MELWSATHVDGGSNDKVVHAQAFFVLILLLAMHPSAVIPFVEVCVVRWFI